MAKTATRSGSRTIITRKQRKEANRAFFHYADSIKTVLQAGHPHLELNLDNIVAVHVVDATYDDIERYKSYHLRNQGPQARSDAVKRAAYYTKWTTKLRPLMFKRKLGTKSKMPDLGLLVNETLAISWGMELLSDQFGKDMRLTPKAQWDFAYDLHFREMGEDALLAQFQLFADLAKARKPNPIIEFSIV